MIGDESYEFKARTIAEKISRGEKMKTSELKIIRKITKIMNDNRLNEKDRQLYKGSNSKANEKMSLTDILDEEL